MPNFAIDPVDSKSEEKLSSKDNLPFNGIFIAATAVIVIILLMVFIIYRKN